MFKNITRKDEVTETGKTYFYINNENKTFGICFNIKDLKNKSKIEKALIYNNIENLNSLKYCENDI